MFEQTPKKMNELELEFTKMVRDYRKTIYTVSYFFSNNPTDVEDLFQEVLVNLWKGFAKFRGDSSPKTWIWRVSLNTCCNIERGKKRSVPTVPLLLDKGLMSDSDEGGAIILLWLGSMRYDEIAAIVGISTAAVTSRLFRIKEQLKSMSNTPEV